ncbi:uncharacterized protein LOC126859260 [Cataglyphis hispanica]|uniref:uncharacterized protein LOC126859260 n=1 Tax=Cataglyphis hispanica TaxID=1086592 RepID=UPI002180554C|nr:uncharacterized protein LOC126859260 [Cataglyphis hispanica]
MSKEESSGETKPQDASAPDVQADVSSKDTNAEIYENRGTKKIIRVVTVMAYLFSVSFVGILLSAYYLFLWEPPNPRLIERGRQRADPQMQFLMATMPSEKTDLKKEGNDFFLNTDINHANKPFLGRMTYGAYDGDDSNGVNSQDRKQNWLNALLLRLKHSLVEAQNQNLSKHATAISGFNNSSIKVEKMLNSTKIMENSISNKLQKNITRSNNIDLPQKFTDSVNVLDSESTQTSKAATVRKSKIKQKNFNERSIINSNLIIDHENQKLSKIDDIKELIKQNETDDRQLINDNRKNDANNVRTITKSKEYAEDVTKRFVSTNVSVNNLNFRQNYSSNNEYLTSNHIEKIMRNEASTISSSHDSGYIHNNPEFHQLSDDQTVVTRNSEETQLERMTAKFKTINNEQLEEADISSTQRQKGLLEILTETTDIEKTSIEFTSVPTVQDYRNFTSTVNIDDSDSVT